MMRPIFGLANAATVTAGATSLVRTNPGEFDDNFFGLC
jgi:hypothetical protein